MQYFFILLATILPFLEVDEARPTRPGESECQAPLATYAPEREWTDQEVWVWNQRICLGENANLSLRPDGLGGGCDLDAAEEWPDDRVLTPQFIETVLFHEPFRSAYARRGFRVSCARFDDQLVLSHGDFAHEIWLRFSYFPSGLNFTDLAVGESLFLTGSRVDEHFEAERLTVSGSLFLRGPEASFQTIDLIDAYIDGNIDLRNSVFRSRFDLTGSIVGGKFIMSDSENKVIWSDGSELILRNFSAEVLQDSQEVWFSSNNNLSSAILSYNLNGFIYNEIKNIEENHSDIVEIGNSEWRIDWIEQQSSPISSHSPQPYHQLASTLRSMGFLDMADDTMVAAMDNYRDASTTPLARKILLWIERLTIGYGYENWRALICLVILLTTGTFVARSDPGLSRLSSLHQQFWYSMDRLVPLIQFDQAHGDFKPSKYSLYFHIHHLVGFVLVSLFIAGLTGITK